MRKNPRGRRLVRVCAVFAAGGVMLLPAPAVAQPPTHSAPARIAEGTYQLVNLETGKCATVAGGVSTGNNLGLVQFDCDMHPARRWELTHWNGDSYQLVNVGTGKCATVAGGVSRANYVGLVQFTCDTHPSRRWSLQAAG
ncbi:RICIN domain-containing protein [Streptomyces sp. NPDC058964]|uniref:RICIN domain-containing protein n=1 Tax=Streptomyces sp. NPDC058964 TaxID=3346681 RepID=UPI003690324D